MELVVEWYTHFAYIFTVPYVIQYYELNYITDVAYTQWNKMKPLDVSISAVNPPITYISYLTENQPELGSSVPFDSLQQMYYVVSDGPRPLRLFFYLFIFYYFYYYFFFYFFYFAFILFIFYLFYLYIYFLFRNATIYADFIGGATIPGWNLSSLAAEFLLLNLLPYGNNMNSTVHEWLSEGKTGL